MPSARRIYSGAALASFVADVLRSFGLSEREAGIGAEVLVDADLAGVDTHGVANLAHHAHYVPGLRNGYVDPTGSVRVLRESPVSAAWDSGRGFGPVVAHQAMSAAIAKAEDTGVGMVAVRDARHFGANGYFAEMAARRGLIAMVSTNTPVAGMPAGALRPVVGPNPFAFAAPLGGRPPMVIDISVTAAAGSKVNRAARSGEPVPLGWVVDAGGRPTTDPAARAAGGGLELLGGQIAGHKGLALGLMVDALGVLAGTGSGLRQGGAGAPWVQGQWFACWRTDLFTDPPQFLAEMRQLAEDLEGTPTRDGRGLRIPGERRAACREKRRREGIPLDAEVVGGLLEVAAETGVPFPPAQSPPAQAREHEQKK